MDLNPFQQIRFGGALEPQDPPLNRGNFYSDMFTGDDSSDTQIQPSPLTKKRFFTATMPQVPAVNQAALAPPKPTGDEAIMQMISSVYGNKGPAQSAYTAALEQQPKREDYRPSAYRRISAGLVGFGAGIRNPAQGPSAASSVLDEPFNEATSDWQTRVKGLDEAAKLERGTGEDQLRTIMSARALGLNTDKFIARNAIDQGKLELSRDVAEAKQRTADRRADAYIKDKTSGKYKEIPQADGSVLMVNQKDPNDTQLIEADTVSAANLRVRQRNAATGERNAATRERGQADTAADRADRRSIARERITATLKPKNLTPAGIQKATDNVLRAMVTDPRFARYVQPSATGYYDFKEDDGTSDYQDFLDEVQKRIETNNPMGDRKKRGSSVTIGAPK